MDKMYNAFYLRTAGDEEAFPLDYERVMKDLYDIQYALDQSSILVITNEKGIITYVNDRFCEISKYERNELIGQTHRLINSGFHPQSFFQHMWKTIKRGDIWRGDIKNRAKDGSEYWVNTTIVPLLNNQGLPYQFVSIRSDITDQKKAEEQLKLALKNDFQQTVKNLQNAVFKYKRTDEGEFQLTLLEGKFSESAGYTTHSVQGKKLDDLFPSKVVKKINAYFTKAYQGKAIDFEIRIFKHAFLIYLSPIFEKGQIVEVVGTATDITKRKKAEKAVYHAAHYDYLTGLPNRRLFQENMNAVDSLGTHYPFAMVFIDLDRIKDINDTMGHNMGDQVLKSVSRRIEECLCAGDMVARIGGDEFAVVLPNTVREEAEEIAERIIRHIEKRIIFHETEIFVTASIGISIYPDDGQDSETLLKHADTAMYLAKETGRNNYQFFTKELQEKNAKKMKLERELHKALESGQFHLHYQPQIDLLSGRLLGMEALIRWEHPEFGMVSPADFIPLAEETGLIVPIGHWVMQTACRQNKKWQDAGFPAVRISINVSVRQFSQPHFVDMVKEVLEQTGLSSDWLDLEVTESMSLEGEFFHSVLQKLKDLSIHVSIDDFGTGYSSLSSLRHFSVNRLKIDQTFVNTLDDTNKAIVAMIIALAKSLKMKVLAEGVETVEQVLFLKEMNCDEAQGYFFAKPMPIEQMDVLFKDLLTNFSSCPTC